MSDFLDLQGAKDLNTDAIHMSAVSNSVDPVTGAAIDAHVNRVGGTDYTLRGFWNALGPVVMPWTSAVGGTLTQPNQAFLHPANGNYYSWSGEFPKVVTPSTDPTAVTGYVPRTDVVLRPAALEALRRSYAEAGYSLVNGSFEKGGVLTSTSDVLLYEKDGKAYSWGGGYPAGGYVVEAGTKPTDANFIARDLSTISESDWLKQYFIDYENERFIDFTKIIVDKSVDNGAIFDSVVSAANTAKVAVFMGNNVESYNLTSSSGALPIYGIIGNFSSNAPLNFTRVRDNARQYGRLNATSVLISGAQYTKFEFIDASSGAVNLNGNALDFGVFWNIFERVRGDLNIDVSSQSINHNLFQMIRGGVHIFGGSASTPSECDGNVILMCDSTGANLTDSSGVSGWHILNEGYKRQRLNVGSLYMEGSGKKAIKGNISTFLGVYSDGVGSPYATDSTCHHIGNGEHNLRNRHDWFSANPISNMAVGGLWDVLNADSVGQPLCMINAGGFPGAVVNDTTLPFGFKYKYGGSSEINYSSLRINLNNSYSGRYGIALIIQTSGAAISIQLENNGSAQTLDSSIYTDLGNNVRLYRISLTSRSDGATDQLTIMGRGGTGNPCNLYIIAAWATPDKTVFMPSPVPAHMVKAVTNTGSPIASIAALPVGGRVLNTNPTLTAPAGIEWVKLGSGALQKILSI